MKRTLLLILLTLTAAAAFAQRCVVRGQALETKTRKPVEFATVALLRTDSAKVVKSANTDETGAFSLSAPEAGAYTLRVSYVGFAPLSRRVEVAAGRDTLDLGELLIESKDNLLGTATVSATAARVEQRDDTTMFNASAYRVPEGSTLEALVKQLPGVEVADNGTIKWNGKTVQELLINGKDFFKGDTKTAMKNLPTELVNKIKAYDKKSDYTEQTGIDDGEETTVLDISTKRQFNESWVSNLDLAYGNHDRYSGRFFGTRFTDHSRVTAFGAANNTNDRGFGGPRGFGGGGGNGLTAAKSAGLDFMWENGKEKRQAGRLELGGNVRYNFSSTDALSTSNSETFLAGGGSGSFANSWSHNRNRNTGVNSAFRLQWNPDTLTFVSFRPQYSFSRGTSDGLSRSATFNDNPYSIPGMENPLDSIFASMAAESSPLYAMMVNTNRRQSLGLSKSHNVSGTLNIVRRLNTAGRNVSLRANAGYGTSESEQYSISRINYNKTSGRKDSFLNQYSNTPGKNWNYSVRLGYSEPLGRNWFAEARYQYSSKYTNSDRSRYNLDSLGSEKYATLWDGAFAAFGDPDNPPAIGKLPTMDDALNLVRDLNNSQYATYRYSNHTASLGVRYNTSSIRFNAGVDFNPEHTKMAYNRPGQHIDTLVTRNVFKVSPQVRFRYSFSKTTQLDVRYRGSSSQPSMTDLLAVVDDSNPLSISMGNPGLKPSWNNTMRVNYNTYNASLQRGMMFGIDATQTSNSISNRLVYDEATGVRYTRPENINGNWNARGMFMFNTGIGPKKTFTVSTFTTLGYNNAVGYVSRLQSSASARRSASAALVPLEGGASPAAERSYDYYNGVFANAVSQKNTTRTLDVGEDFNASYRTTYFDVGLLGRLNYQHARASVQDNANMDTWNFAYGANANINLDFGLSVSTDIRMNSRRGYSDRSMNTNELLWNAQISQSFLKGRAATVSVQFYDILRQQSNVSRSLTATMRQDSWNNAINSYFMVHFIYKLNIFPGGSKKGAGKGGDRPGTPDMRGPGGMRPMGPPPGGGGGFRHGGF